MTNSPAAIEETIAAVAARLREWIGLNAPGIVWIRYVSDRSRDLLLDRLSFERSIERIEFNPPDLAQAADWLEDQLRKVEQGDTLPIVAVLFSPLLHAGEAGFAAAFRSLNLRREVIARSPMIQLWWVPASAAPRAEAEALDLASWFQIRMTLSEIVVETRPESSLRVQESAWESPSGEPLKSLEDAVARQRKLVQADSASYSPQLASALNKLADRLRSLQRIREAETYFQEALSILRGMPEGSRDAYLPDVAETLNSLGTLYSKTQRTREAESAYQEALKIRRNLAVANPQANLRDVASVLNNLGNLYSDTQRMGEAESAYQEALKIRRNLAAANPQAHLPDVAQTLNNLAILYHETQRTREAESAYQEALKIRRNLAAANPQAYLPDVAQTLNNLATLLYRNTQRTGEAESAFQEALQTYRGLAEAHPQAYLPYVAGTLNNLALLYCDTLRTEEAESAYREAVRIFRRLAQTNPQGQLPSVALTLNNLASLYLDTDRTTEAESSCSEAQAILEQQWERNPELHGDTMTRIYWNHALIADRKGSPGACEFARKMLASAYEPGFKRTAQELIDRFCGPSFTSAHE